MLTIDPEDKLARKLLRSPCAVVMSFELSAEPISERNLVKVLVLDEVEELESVEEVEELDDVEEVELLEPSRLVIES